MAILHAPILDQAGFYIGSSSEVKSYVYRLNGSDQYFQLSEDLTLSNGQVMEFECVGTHEGGVLISTASFGLQFRLIGGVYDFFGCDAEVNGVPATSGVTTYDGGDITSFKLTVTTARPLGTLASKSISFLSPSAMRKFKRKESNGNVINEIPLTNKAQGATQLPTIGSVSATIVGYNENDWEEV